MKSKKDIIIGAVISLALLGGLIWVAGSSAKRSTTSKSPQVPSALRPLVADAPFYDFGKISMAAGTVRRGFAVKNTSAAPIIAAKLYTSCMCTTATLRAGDNTYGPYGMPGHGFTPRINAAIAPGETAQISVAFDPAAHGPAGVGAIQRTVTLETDSGGALELRFSALVTP